MVAAIASMEVLRLKEKSKQVYLAGRFDSAADLLSVAIELSPHDPKLFVKRAHINNSIGNFNDAIADANKAIKLDPKLPKAYLQKAHAYIMLEDYCAAKATLETGSSFAPGDSRFTDWIDKCDIEDKKHASRRPPVQTAQMSNGSVQPADGASLIQPVLKAPISNGFVEPPGLASLFQPVQKAPIRNGLVERVGMASLIQPVQKAPISSGPVEPAGIASPDPPIEKDPKSDDLVASTGNPPPESNPSSVICATSAKPKFRHDYYQKPEEVVVNIFAKGTPAKSVTVFFKEQILTVVIIGSGEVLYQLVLLLSGEIIPSKCRYEVLPTKIEIRLAKAEAIYWTSLGSTVENSGQQEITLSTVDWDKVVAEFDEKEKEIKLDGNEATNKCFRDIYKNGDEDAKRSMTKSFVESNGTVLSTDWKDVAVKKVEASIPDGLELKKWEY